MPSWIPASETMPSGMSTLLFAEFVGSPLYYILMVVVLLGAIGLFWYVRNKQ